jgi:hypothetical protein
MNQDDLPKHVLGRIERRWAARLQREARAWHREKREATNEVVVDRGGRTVRVTIKRATQPRVPKSAVERVG